MPGESGKGVAPRNSVQLRGGSVKSLIKCPGCHESKSYEDWGDVEVSYDPKDAPPVCTECRTNGIPQVRHYKMPLHYRLALKAYLGAANPREALKAASEASGLTKASIQNLIAGRRSPEFRMAFQRLMEMRGLDMNSVTNVLADAMKAKEHKWNPHIEEFEHFDDHRTRLNTVKHVTKLMQLDPPVNTAPIAAVQVTINHNLGDGEEIDPPGVFRIKPKPVDDEVIDIE